MQDKIVINKRCNRFFRLGICLLFLNSFFACSNVDMAQFEARTAAFGKVNHMVVVADQQVWESAVGDTFRYYFSSAYPILPQPEPVFDLRHWTPRELTSEPVRQKKRTYLILGDLSNEDSPASKMILADIGAGNGERARSEKTFNSTIGKNKWADGQTVVYLFGNSEEELANNIKAKFPAISRRVNDADSEIVEATVYSSGDGLDLNNKIQEKMGVTMRVPADYILAIEDEKTMWLRKETDFVSSNIFLYKTKYENKDQFTKEGIKAIRDSLGKKFVSTDVENTYMRTNDEDLPMLTKVVTLNDNYAVEARGIWDIVNDFMGGPYISYLIHNPETNDLLFVDGFVHAPGKKKRDYIQQLEYVFRSIEM